MSSTDINFTFFQPDQASDSDWEAMAFFRNRLMAETLPEDPPLPMQEIRQNWSNIPPVVERKAWYLSSPNEKAWLAFGYVEYVHLEAYEHMAQFQIQVAQEVRRQGLGRALLLEIARDAQVNQRRLLMAETNDSIPAGMAFMEKIGAMVGLETHINQLNLAELDQGKIAAWKQLAHQRAQDFDLGFWDGPYPLEALEQMALIKQAMNQQPLDNLDVEDIQWTPALLQQLDDSMVQRGTGRWTFFAREHSSGNLAGFTEIFWQPGKPEIAQQGDTGVLEKYRNRGLGRWLKAAMLEKVLTEKSRVKFVRTMNADSNAPMLKINQELGFRPYRSTRVWQMETDKVFALLNG